MQQLKKIGYIDLQPKAPKEAIQDYFSKTRAVEELKPKDFDPRKTYMLNKPPKQCMLIMFYAPWCGYCKRTKDTWIELGKSMSFMTIAGFNCEKFREFVEKINFDAMRDLGRKHVQGFPSVYLYKPDGSIVRFEQERTPENLLQFCVHHCK